MSLCCDLAAVWMKFHSAGSPSHFNTFSPALLWKSEFELWPLERTHTHTLFRCVWEYLSISVSNLFLSVCLTRGLKLTILLSLTMRQGRPSLKPYVSSTSPEQSLSHSLLKEQALRRPVSVSRSPLILYVSGITAHTHTNTRMRTELTHSGRSQIPFFTQPHFSARSSTWNHGNLVPGAKSCERLPLLRWWCSLLDVFDCPL